MAEAPPPVDAYIPASDPNEGRLMRKIRESPLMAGGLLGWVGLVSYGLYNIKNRKHGLALHLIHTRVYAQAFVVGSLTLGVCYQLFTNHIKPWALGEPRNTKSGGP